MENVGIVLVAGFVAAFITILWIGRGRRSKKSTKVNRRGGGNAANRRVEAQRASSRQRDEALFVSMFPELQPHFHPEALVQFVRANRERIERSASDGAQTWSRPPGFGVAAMDLEPDAARTLFRMKDAGGALLGSFHFEPHPEGGVLRVGKGKLTVNVADDVPRVRYWHPEREFKWSERKGWIFVTPMVDSGIANDDRDTSTSGSFRDTSQSESPSPAPFEGRGGTFDGGGASGGWDDAPAAEGARAASDSQTVVTSDSSPAATSESTATAY